MDRYLAIFPIPCDQCAGLVEREKQGGTHRVLQNIFSSERKTLYLLLGCSFVCVRFYFARGGMHWAADASHHIAQSYLVARAIADGELPIWTFLMGMDRLTCKLRLRLLLSRRPGRFFLPGYIPIPQIGHVLHAHTLWNRHVLFGEQPVPIASRRIYRGPGLRAVFLAHTACTYYGTITRLTVLRPLALVLLCCRIPYPIPYKVRAALIGGLSIALLNFTHPGYGLSNGILGMLLYRAALVLMEPSRHEIVFPRWRFTPGPGHLF